MTLDSIKNALFAAMHGMTPEEYTLQKARENLASVTSGFLRKNPEYLRGRFAEDKPANGLECLKAPTDSPVNKTTDKKSNKTKKLSRCWVLMLEFSNLMISILMRSKEQRSLVEDWSPMILNVTGILLNHRGWNDCEECSAGADSG
ncbi:hypothetical protein [Citrobacter sp. FDAARGOS_156]|uniref:hypothetical protein n=1 Tax=Citrobacter sp. FDAARGOS_156 TaxID=1702170 RepID=UPI001F1B85AF|nr:hypothetical protein [Citrobacter sp. FDAARGOS_156]